MFFKKKKSKECPNCEAELKKDFQFCPYCGTDLIDRDDEEIEYGLIGRTNANINRIPKEFGLDKMIKTMMSSFMNDAEITTLPNGVQIRIGSPVQRKQPQQQQRKIKKAITEEQIKKMTNLPRTKAETSMKRLNNKIVYELDTPDVSSPEDVFISKLESGYEVKAIGAKKVYANNLPINLPVKSIILSKGKLTFEFQEH